MDSQKIRRAASWEEVAARIPTAMGDAADLLKQQHQAGVLKAWVSDSAGILTRVEGQELVVVAMEGRGLDELTKRIICTAKQAGLSSIRAHTKRPALLRALQRIEPRIQRREIVIELEL